MTYFPEVETWRIPDAAMVESLAEMARDGREGREGIVLWLGRRDNGAAEISHLVVLRGKGIVKEPDLLIIGAELMNDVADLAIELGVCLVGQIHSHGKLYGTNLSPTDRKYGIVVPFFLSLVAPDYALRPDTRIEECGVHIFEPSIGYRRLTPPEVLARIRVVCGESVPVLTVGEGE
ncbi:MAG: hypothetical protein L0338_35855 [Acidobacteria bacterium]|nr:hypothetical protein [Acidobacteriota bacterium]